MSPTVLGPNEKFSQVPHELLVSGVSDGAIVTYAAIRKVAWHVGSEYFQGEQALADARGCSVRTIRNHIRELENVYAIEVIQNGRRRNSTIVVCAYGVIWTVEDAARANERSEVTGRNVRGDGQESAGLTGNDLPVPIEEDDIKKTFEVDDLPRSAPSSGEDLDTPEEGRARLNAHRDQEPSVEYWWRVDGDVLEFDYEYGDTPEAKELRIQYERMIEATGPVRANTQMSAVVDRHPQDLEGALDELGVAA